MEIAAAVVGIVSGLISIFTFVTGMTNLAELRRQLGQRQLGEGRPEQGQPGQSREPTEQPVGRTKQIGKLQVLVWTCAVLFGVAFAVTLAVSLILGLSGSDEGGIAFLLLAVAGIMTVVDAWVLRRFVPWPVLLVVGVPALGALGYLFGFIGRGEEVPGLIMGLVSGLGIGVVALLLRSKLLQY